MRFSCEPFELRLRHPFNVSYARTPSGSPHVRTVVFVHFECEGIVGTGEASPSKRYNESAESIVEFVRTLSATQLPVPYYKDAFLHAVDQHAPGNTAAKCAIDMAWHDWWCKSNGASLAQYLALRHMPRAGTEVSSFTIGIDDVDTIAAKVREADQYPVLKIKLGAENDEQIFETVRDNTDKPLRVDANEGWGSKEHALKMIEWLRDKNVELIEQPLPAAMDRDMPWLKERSPLPIYADESVGRRWNVQSLADGFHGVNLKLMKITGIGEAIRMIDEIRETDMRIMMGCFIETSLAVTAAAHFTPYVDCADLDGAALCENDPYRGATIDGGVIRLSAGAGIGAERIS